MRKDFTWIEAGKKGKRLVLLLPPASATPECPVWRLSAGKAAQALKIRTSSYGAHSEAEVRVISSRCRYHHNVFLHACRNA